MLNKIKCKSYTLLNTKKRGVRTDSNRRTGFCRPLPYHSATPPFNIYQLPEQLIKIYKKGIFIVTIGINNLPCQNTLPCNCRVVAMPQRPTTRCF